MFRASARPSPALCRFPHSRGDVPWPLLRDAVDPTFSPLTWGCSGHSGGRRRPWRVFPTHVGMFRGLRFTVGYCHGFSPLTWGCSAQRGATCRRRQVFPTHVGMFLRVEEIQFRAVRFPHSRGDVPTGKSYGKKNRAFSPLTWGCSIYDVHYLSPSCVFPTHVGMFHCSAERLENGRRFPHSRGDVPCPTA